MDVMNVVLNLQKSLSLKSLSNNNSSGTDFQQNLKDAVQDQKEPGKNKESAVTDRGQTVSKQNEKQENQSVENNPVEETKDEKKSDKKENVNDTTDILALLLQLLKSGQNDMDTNNLGNGDTKKLTSIDTDKLINVLLSAKQSGNENVSAILGELELKSDTGIASSLAQNNQLAEIVALLNKTNLNSIKEQLSGVVQLLTNDKESNNIDGKTVLNQNSILKDLKELLKEKTSTSTYGQDNVNNSKMTMVNQAKPLVADLNKDLKELLKEKTSTSTHGQDNVNNFKMTMVNQAKSLASDLNKDPKSKGSTNKDEQVLKSILSSDKSDSLFKVLHLPSSSQPVQTITSEAVGNSPVIRQTNVQTDFIQSIKFMDQNNLKDLTVKIMPKELGEVIIKLTLENGAMKASVSASNKDAYQLLQSNLPEIVDKLSQSDIRIQDFSINIYNGDTTFFKQGSQSNDGQQSSRQGRTGLASSENEMNLETEDIASIDSNVNILA